MRSALSAPLFALLIGAACHGAPALAQSGAVGPQDLEKVKQVFVYGEDPCPPGQGDEIVVCARLPDNDRYRIPKELRSDPNAPANQAWASRARTLEVAGASGINSCSPVGAGGMTGCFNQLAARAKEERKTLLGSASWADAVAAEREKRLGNLDAESEEVEARVKAEEAEEARKADAARPAPPTP
jgi:hypothetical protein